jgi:hypothetical protein
VTWSDALSRNVIAASAEGYAFPTNLDLDQPSDGSFVPESQAEVVARALDEGWTPVQLDEQLYAHSGRRLTTPCVSGDSSSGSGGSGSGDGCAAGI